MARPTDVGVIDLMLGIPEGSKKNWYGFLRAGLMDKESKEEFDFPVEYMFKEVPKDVPEEADSIGAVLDEMDHFGIDKAMVGVSFHRNMSVEAVEKHPDRFFGSYEVNPNRGMEGIRELVRAVEELGCKAATAFPAGMTPQVPINDKKFFPYYAKCIELDIPICVCTGVPGHVARHLSREVVTDYYTEENAKVLGPVKAFFEKHGIANFSTQARHGHAPEEILKTATESGAELIVMGTHGHGILGRALMGSVATKVLSETDTSVLLVQ